MTRKVTITKQEMADGTRWNAQVWTTVNPQHGFAYWGMGRFCKSLEEAEAYKKKVLESALAIGEKVIWEG